MKMNVMYLCLLLLSATNCLSTFYSIKSEREFNRKVNNFDYSFVCFANDDFNGERIKNMMRNLAYDEDFGHWIGHQIAFLFVHADQPSLKGLAQSLVIPGSDLGSSNKINSPFPSVRPEEDHSCDLSRRVKTDFPFFVVLHKRQKIAASTLGFHYSVEIMKRFIGDSMKYEGRHEN